MGTQQEAVVAVSANGRSLMSLRQQCTAFLELIDALGFSRSEVADSETISAVEVMHPIPSDKVLAWDFESICARLRILGADVHLRMTTQGADSAFDVPEAAVSGADYSSLAGFLTSLRDLVSLQGNDLYVYTSVTFDKSAARRCLAELLAQRAGILGSREMLSNTTAIVFFQTEAWHKLVSFGAIWSWESSGILSAGHRLVILLCDTAGYLSGEAIEILGAHCDGDIPWFEMSTEAWKEFAERNSEICKLRSQESNWNVELTITPEQFKIRELKPGLRDVLSHLAAVQAAFSAVYLANTVVKDHSGDEVILQFAGDRPAHMRLPYANNQQSIPGEYRQCAVTDLAMWAYRHGSPDKLLMARECLARVLPRNAEISLEVLEREAMGALEAAKSNFVIYLRNNTTQYFKQRQQAFDAVYAYAEGVEASVSRLSTDLASNTYKIAGLLAAAIGAALIEPSVTIQLLSLAVIVQVLYLLFVILYVLPASKRRYNSAKEVLEQRLTLMSELSTRERDQIRQTAGGADCDFQSAYRAASRIYAGMCLVCLVLPFVASHLLATATEPHHPASGALPMMTSTPAPHK